MVTTMLIGSIHSRYIAAGEVPPDWPERAVGAMWPALAGDGATGDDPAAP